MGLQVAPQLQPQPTLAQAGQTLAAAEVSNQKLFQTPAPDSEFQRDSNATFAIGNSIAAHYKHSTTFKEFLAWKESQKRQTNAESINNRASDNRLSDPLANLSSTEKQRKDSRQT